jgi:hypothetical protein
MFGFSESDSDFVSLRLCSQKTVGHLHFSKAGLPQLNPRSSKSKDLSGKSESERENSMHLLFAAGLQ